MKSGNHEHQKSNIFNVSKKMVLLALLVVGTTAFANVKPVAAKGTVTKEISIRKHRKAIKKVKKAEAPKTEAVSAKK